MCGKIRGKSAEFPKLINILAWRRDYTLFPTIRRRIQVSYYYWQKSISTHFYVPYYY